MAEPEDRGVAGLAEAQGADYQQVEARLMINIIIVHTTTIKRERDYRACLELGKHSNHYHLVVVFDKRRSLSLMLIILLMSNTKYHTIDP